MKMLRSLLVLALVLFAGPVLAQVTPGTSPLSIAKGGTGGATASAARSSLGVPTGTSGAVLGFLNTANTWSAQQSFSTVAIGGASIGSNALAVTGTSAFGGNTTLTTGGTSAITVASTIATGDAYFVSQNSSHSWIVGTNGDGVCGAVTGTHIFLFYDATNTACRGLITAAGGWIIGSATEVIQAGTPARDFFYSTNSSPFTVSRQHTARRLMREFLGRIWMLARPYRVRLILGLICASLYALIAAFLSRKEARETFVTQAQLRRVSAVFVPTVLFCLATQFLGLYVASFLLISGFMRMVGKIALWKSLLTALVFTAVMFVTFDIAFDVIMPKGPLEAALGR